MNTSLGTRKCKRESKDLPLIRDKCCTETLQEIYKRSVLVLQSDSKKEKKKKTIIAREQ
jgi:hypothetical protein